MKLLAIKKIVQTYSMTEIVAAEKAILEEKRPSIDIFGQDEGEQLTHLYGAKWILEYVEKEQVELKEGLRAFTQKVRNSID